MTSQTGHKLAFGALVVVVAKIAFAVLVVIGLVPAAQPHGPQAPFVMGTAQVVTVYTGNPPDRPYPPAPPSPHGVFIPEALA